MIAYLDSSVALRYILNGDPAIHHVSAIPRVVSSELLEIECRRVIERARLEGLLDDDDLVAARDRLGAVLDGTDLFLLSAAIKERAKGTFPVVVRTLDALHMATAEFLAGGVVEHGGAVHLFSFDRAMNRCARSLGLITPFAENNKSNPTGVIP